jgi:hypothetical protein
MDKSYIRCRFKWMFKRNGDIKSNAKFEVSSFLTCLIQPYFSAVYFSDKKLSQRERKFRFSNFISCAKSKHLAFCNVKYGYGYTAVHIKWILY